MSQVSKDKPKIKLASTKGQVANIDITGNVTSSKVIGYDYSNKTTNIYNITLLIGDNPEIKLVIAGRYDPWGFINHYCSVTDPNMHTDAKSFYDRYLETCPKDVTPANCVAFYAALRQRGIKIEMSNDRTQHIFGWINQKLGNVSAGTRNDLEQTLNNAKLLHYTQAKTEQLKITDPKLDYKALTVMYENMNKQFTEFRHYMTALMSNNGKSMLFAEAKNYDDRDVRPQLYHNKRVFNFYMTVFRNYVAQGKKYIPQIRDELKGFSFSPEEEKAYYDDIMKEITLIDQHRDKEAGRTDVLLDEYSDRIAKLEKQLLEQQTKITYLSVRAPRAVKDYEQDYKSKSS